MGKRNKGKLYLSRKGERLRYETTEQGYISERKPRDVRSYQRREEQGRNDMLWKKQRYVSMWAPAVTKNDVATASGPGISGFSVNGKWKNAQIRSPKEPSMICRIQGEGHKSFVIHPFWRRRWCSGSDVRTLNVLGLVSSILARARYIFIEPFVVTCGRWPAGRFSPLDFCGGGRRGEHISNDFKYFRYSQCHKFFFQISAQWNLPFFA